MSKSQIVSAIDIGSSKVTTLIAQVSFDEMTSEVSANIVGVSSLSSRGVKKGQIVDIEDAVEVTIESVEAAERMAGYSLDRAYVSIAGSHVASQNSTGVVAVSNPDGEISGGDVERVIDAAKAVSLPASREIIHVIPREYIVDGESGVKDPVGMSGVRLEVDTHIVTVSSPALKNLMKTITEVGVAINGVVFSGIAAGYSCLTSTEKELGCVIVDIGFGTTSVTAFVDGGVSYSGAIPIGARNVTNDLAIGLRVSLEDAEKIKLSLGRASDPKGDKKIQQIEIPGEGSGEIRRVQRRTLTDGIIRPRLNEIFTMVKLELEKSNILNRIPSGVIVTGGGSLTCGVVESAKKVLLLPVRVAQPTGVGGLVDDVLEPPFAVPVGLILYGISRGENIGVAASVASLGKKVGFPSKSILSKLVETVKGFLP
jgi:cell division protein FtsA